MDSFAKSETTSQDDHRPVWLDLQFRKQCAKLFRREYVWVCLSVAAFRPSSLDEIVLDQLPSGRTLEQHPKTQPRSIRKAVGLDYSDKQEIRVPVCAALTRLGAQKRLARVISRRESHLLIRFALVMRTHLDRHLSAKAPKEIEELICREAAEMSIH